MFSARASAIFKRVQVVRFFDQTRNALALLEAGDTAEAMVLGDSGDVARIPAVRRGIIGTQETAARLAQAQQAGDLLRPPRRDDLRLPPGAQAVRVSDSSAALAAQ